jgi:hypothetical protein
MAGVLGLQTSEDEKDRKVILVGTATMEVGDDVLLIDIPTEHQAPTGRETELKFEVKLTEVKDVP